MGGSKGWYSGKLLKDMENRWLPEAVGGLRYAVLHQLFPEALNFSKIGKMIRCRMHRVAQMRSVGHTSDNWYKTTCLCISYFFFCLETGTITYPGLRGAIPKLSPLLPYRLHRKSLVHTDTSAKTGIPPAPNFNVIWRADWNLNVLVHHSILCQCRLPTATWILWAV